MSDRTRNGKLKAAIFEAGLSQRQLARETGIPEAHVSMGLNGKFIFDEDQQRRVAMALGKSREELFG